MFVRRRPPTPFRLRRDRKLLATASSPERDVDRDAADAFVGDMHAVEIVAEFDECLRPTLPLLLCEPFPRIRWTGVTLDAYMIDPSFRTAFVSKDMVSDKKPNVRSTNSYLFPGLMRTTSLPPHPSNSATRFLGREKILDWKLGQSIRSSIGE